MLGVWASPRVVEDGEAVPRGGGGYLVGRPYTIGGHRFFPTANPEGYSVVGTASWYGDAFQGRRTANGEVFDKHSISAAHPTLPLPSYVRVTNLTNNRSMIVRVNDRGPYHGGRVMDVSQRVAEALNFKGEGTARIRVDYVGRASLAGSDDDKLSASLRTDGGPAQLGGVMVAGQAEDTPPVTPPGAPPEPAPREAVVPAARAGRGRGRAAPLHPRQDPWSSLRNAGSALPAPTLARAVAASAPNAPPSTTSLFSPASRTVRTPAISFASPSSRAAADGDGL